MNAFVQRYRTRLTVFAVVLLISAAVLVAAVRTDWFVPSPGPPDRDMARVPASSEFLVWAFDKSLFGEREGMTFDFDNVFRRGGEVPWTGMIGVEFEPEEELPKFWGRIVRGQTSRIAPEISKILGVPFGVFDFETFYTASKFVVAVWPPTQDVRFLYDDTNPIWFSPDAPNEFQKNYEKEKCVATVSMIGSIKEADYVHYDYGQVQRTNIVMADDLPEDEIARCLVGNLTLGLGLTGEVEKLKYTVPFDDGSGFTDFSLDVKILLRALYDPRITRGMPRDEAMAVAREIIPVLVAAVKMDGIAALYQKVNTFDKWWE